METNNDNRTMTIADITNTFETILGQKRFVTGYISKAELAEKKDKKEKYLKCSIGDNTGSLAAKLWDEKISTQIFEELINQGKSAVCVDVECTVKKWNDGPDLHIETINLRWDRKIIDFIEKSKDDPKNLFEKMRKLIERVDIPSYRQLLDALFNKDYPYPNEEIKAKIENIRIDFYRSAAATGHHHNYIHGLMEHSYKVTTKAIQFGEDYEEIYPVNYGLLITGGTLHDIGKIYEYLYKEGIDYSDEGPYVLHTVSGSILIHDLIRELGIEMPRKEYLELLHLVNSHHGEFSEHTPNEHCVEAHLLALADLVDSRVNGIFREFANGRARRMKNRFFR